MQYSESNIFLRVVQKEKRVQVGTWIARMYPVRSLSLAAADSKDEVSHRRTILLKVPLPLPCRSTFFCRLPVPFVWLLWLTVSSPFTLAGVAIFLSMAGVKPLPDKSFCTCRECRSLATPLRIRRAAAESVSPSIGIVKLFATFSKRLRMPVAISTLLSHRA